MNRLVPQSFSFSSVYCTPCKSSLESLRGILHGINSQEPLETVILEHLFKFSLYSRCSAPHFRSLSAPLQFYWLSPSGNSPIQWECAYHFFHHKLQLAKRRAQLAAFCTTAAETDCLEIPDSFNGQCIDLFPSQPTPTLNSSGAFQTQYDICILFTSVPSHLSFASERDALIICFFLTADKAARGMLGL